MENKIIFLDTSVIIEYYRKKDKSKSFYYELTKTYSLFAVSAITEYEVLVGSNDEQDIYWKSFFEQITILPFTEETNKTAIKIYRQLKRISKLIPIPDLLIGATALNNNLPVATLNKKHFSRIVELEIIERE